MQLVPGTINKQEHSKTRLPQYPKLHRLRW